MRSVLDLNVALKWVIAEPHSDKAIRLREDYQNGVHEFIAPESFLIECANALTKKERQKLVKDARTLWDDIMGDAPILFPIRPMDRAIEISLKTHHNFYDCLYVALAEREGCDLITGDDKLVKSLPCISVHQAAVVFPLILHFIGTPRQLGRGLA